MEKILVTGGCGFIGVNLVRSLSKEGKRVRVLDLCPAPICVAGGEAFLRDSWKANDVEVLVGDVREKNLCQRAVRGMDAVVHLAAESGVLASFENPEKYFSVNVEGTLNLLLGAKEENIRKFVFASSGAVLGRYSPPGDELTPALPMSPYGASKLSAEAYTLAFGESYGFSSVVLRFSNIYGPGSAHKRSVVSEFCKRALLGESLVIFGDGTQARDFLYVYDLTSGIRLCLNKPEVSGVFQMGSGVPVSIIEVAETIQYLCRRDMGRTVPIEFCPAKENEVRRSYYRIDKARDVLGFSPSVDFRKGLEGTWKWFLKNAAANDVTSRYSE